MLKKWCVLLPALLIVLAGALPAGVGAQPAQDGPMIYLARASFDPLAGEPALAGVAPALQQPAPGGNVYLLQFDGPVQEDWKATVQAAGIELLSYIPDYAYLARLAGGETVAAAKLPHVRWVGPYRAAYKIEPSLDALAPEADAPLMVRLFRGEDRAAAEAAVRALGGQVEETVESELLGDAIRTTLPAARIADVAVLPAVAWVEPWLPMELTNDRAREIMQVNAAWTTLAGMGTSLYGAGQIVDVTDTGLDTGNATTLNQDFRDRFIKAYMWGGRGTWNDPDSHGTHVAGSLLGSGRNSGSLPASHNYSASFAGVAPEAGLIDRAGDAAGRLRLHLARRSLHREPRRRALALGLADAFNPGGVLHGDLVQQGVVSRQATLAELLGDDAGGDAWAGEAIQHAAHQLFDHGWPHALGRILVQDDGRLGVGREGGLAEAGRNDHCHIGLLPVDGASRAGLVGRFDHLDEAGHVFALQHVDQELAAGFGRVAGPVEIDDLNARLRQVEAASPHADIAEGEVQQPRDEQRRHEHHHQREGAAKMAQQVLQGDVPYFHGKLLIPRSIAPCGRRGLRRRRDGHKAPDRAHKASRTRTRRYATDTRTNPAGRGRSGARRPLPGSAPGWRPIGCASLRAPPIILT